MFSKISKQFNSIIRWVVGGVLSFSSRSREKGGKKEIPKEYKLKTRLGSCWGKMGVSQAEFSLVFSPMPVCVCICMECSLFVVVRKEAGQNTEAWKSFFA